MSSKLSEQQSSTLSSANEQESNSKSPTKRHISEADSVADVEPPTKLKRNSELPLHSEVNVSNGDGKRNDKLNSEVNLQRRHIEHDQEEKERNGVIRNDVEECRKSEDEKEDEEEFDDDEDDEEESEDGYVYNKGDIDNVVDEDSEEEYEDESQDMIAINENNRDANCEIIDSGSIGANSEDSHDDGEDEDDDDDDDDDDGNDQNGCDEDSDDE